MKWKFKRKKIYQKAAIFLAIICGFAYYFCLPHPLFNEPTSTVIESNDGTLLGAKIAADEQWRFPEIDTVPYKFEQSLLIFEDQYFYKHPGFNPISLTKAFFENLKAGKVVRGGSTLTQQVIRLSRKGQKRSYIEKFIELIWATRLEWGYSKKDILRLYASHAPFGGNVVGLDMASWRYFGIPSSQLSWAESATLAVLPNAPSLIFPGKNQELLLSKRNSVLKKLYKNQVIDSSTYQLALQESLPGKPFALPRIAPHLLDHIQKTKNGEKIKTTLNKHLQEQTNERVKQHYAVLKQNEVHNAAVLVMEVSTKKVLAYVGNTPTDNGHEKDVDMVQAGRSTGSTLKPFLYASMLDKGELLPKQLVPDIPTTIAGYQPQNYDETFSGAVPADRALARSLNIPAVRLLQEYGLQRFRDELNYYKMKNLIYEANHYGLSLIVGGAEASLWDLCKSYAALAGTLENFNKNGSQYFENELSEPVLTQDQEVAQGALKSEKNMLGAGSIWLTFEALKKVNRPEGDEAWEFYDSSKAIAWKTGTSFGNRDAWAIGVTPQYVVGVWVGNADGEGRPELTGLHAAAPLLFDIFDFLPTSGEFDIPFDDLKQVEVCQKSGSIASLHCPSKKQWVALKTSVQKSCGYHKIVHLDTTESFQVNSSCEQVSQMKHTSWFVLPPLQAYYYKNKNATYKELPPFRKDCGSEKIKRMDFIFPKGSGIVHLPKNVMGKTNDLVLKLAHTDANRKVYWYLNQTYLGMTKTFHEIAIQPKTGEHTITVLDDAGNALSRSITIKSSEET